MVLSWQSPATGGINHHARGVIRVLPGEPVCDFQRNIAVLVNIWNL